MQKLFQATLVVFLAAVSIAALAMIISVVVSMLSPQMVAESNGITAVAIGVTTRQIGFMIVAASLVIAGLYLFVRRRRFRR